MANSEYYSHTPIRSFQKNENNERYYNQYVNKKKEVEELRKIYYNFA
ncbi:MAG: hypothetical protein RLZZ143_1750 [Cyanobacteriota bacterium]